MKVNVTMNYSQLHRTPFCVASILWILVSKLSCCKNCCSNVIITFSNHAIT